MDDTALLQELVNQGRQVRRSTAPVLSTVKVDQGLAGTAEWKVKDETARTSLAAIAGAVDTLEALIGTTNTSLTTLLTQTDTIEALLAALAASATQAGTTPYKNTALSNTKQEVKDTSGRLYGWHVFNPGATTTYVQCFDLDADDVTVGTTAPTFVLAIPSIATAPVGLDSHLPTPVAFANALTIAATTGAANSTAPATALVTNLFYI